MPTQNQGFPWLTTLLSLSGLYLLISSIGAWITGQAFLGITLSAAPHALVAVALIGLLLIIWNWPGENSAIPAPVGKDSAIVVHDKRELGLLTPEAEKELEKRIPFLSIRPLPGCKTIMSEYFNGAKHEEKRILEVRLEKELLTPPQ